MTSPRTWLARHAQTLLGSLGRLARQPAGTFMTMAVIGIALALPLSLGVFLENVRGATANWNQAFDLSVYMNASAAASHAQTLAKTLRSRNDVATVRVISAEEGMSQFRAQSGFGTALDALGENPLPDTLVVTPAIAASNSRGTETLRSAIAVMPGVQAVQLDAEWVNRLHGILEILERGTWLTGALLALGVYLVIGNTIRLDILNRRPEIEVLKLVGASDSFTRRPFLYSGIWYGLGGGLLALGLVSAAVVILNGPTRRLAALYGSQFSLTGLTALSAVALVLCSATLGWLGSWLAASRHIRAIDPT